MNWCFLRDRLAVRRNKSRSQLSNVMTQVDQPLWHCTALMAAARQGYGDIVDLLLNKGADANVVCCCGSTALFWAARFNRKHVVSSISHKIGQEVNSFLYLTIFSIIA